MLGKPVPDFSLPSTGHSTFTLFRARGRKPVLCLYLQNTYGKKVRAIERSTFVLDREGVLSCDWRGIKLPGHVQEVLNFAKAL